MTFYYGIDDLDNLEQQLQTPRDIALLRLGLLLDNDYYTDANDTNDSSKKNGAGTDVDTSTKTCYGEGFASAFVPLLQQRFDAWFTCSTLLDAGGDDKHPDSTITTSTSPLLETTQVLSRVLELYVLIAEKDPTLAEELGRQGSHNALSKLIRCDTSALLSMQEEDEEQEEDSITDAIMALQDLACQIASLSSARFPLRTSPFSLEELKDRLPRCISFAAAGSSSSNDNNTKADNQYSILIQQVTTRQSAQEDVGFVLWPSAVALSEWLLSHPDVLQNSRSILELGAGCGLVGLLAAQLAISNTNYRVDGEATEDGGNDLNTKIIISDFNSIVLENMKRNIDLNGVQKTTTSQKLDFYKQTGDREYWVSDDEATPQEQVDLILAADMICQPSDAVAAANSIHDALKPSGKAIVICADGKH